MDTTLQNVRIDKNLGQQAVASFMQFAENGKYDTSNLKLEEWKIYCLTKLRTNTGTKLFNYTDGILYIHLPAFAFKICSLHTCTNPSCYHLHICKNIFNSNQCSYGARCQYTHEINCNKNKLLLEKFYLECGSIEDFKKIFEWRNNCNIPKGPQKLQVCFGYQRENCKYSATGKCVRLHFCERRLRLGKCEASCKLCHNILDEDCLIVLKLYGFDIDQPPEIIVDDLRKHLQIELPQIFPEAKEIFKPLAPAICADNLSHSCQNGDSCLLRHTNEKYAWDYVPWDNHIWVQFDSKTSQLLEEAYSAPSLAEAIDINIKYNSTYKLNNCQARINFESMTMTASLNSDDKEHHIRRISANFDTKSSNYNFFATQYAWYFLNDKNVYEEFGLCDPLINSEYLEKFYQIYVADKSESDIKYKVNQCEYVLNLKTMLQKNLQTEVQRKVIRRPAQLLKRVGLGKWICGNHLKSNCKFGEKCVNRHIKEKYAWDIEGLDGYWYECPFPAEQIEEAYSDPDPQVTFTVQSPEASTFDFVNMTYQLQNKNAPAFPLRRVTVQPPHWSPTSQFVTEYSWYLLDGDKVIKFGEINPLTHNPSDYIHDSAYFEFAFLKYQLTGNLKSAILTFIKDQYIHSLDFKLMTLYNLATGEKKQVIRRPVAVDILENTTTATICLANCAKPEGSFCSFNSCPNLHKALHYCWQYRRLRSKQQKSWKDYCGDDIKAQQSLEVTFCVPHNFGTTVYLKPTGKSATLVFHTLEAKSTTGRVYEFRRTATTSAKENDSEKLEPFTNKYTWYWYSECDKRYIPVDVERYVNSDKLETLLANKQRRFQFNAKDGFAYRFEDISERGAIIVNTRNNCRRLVHRRPTFISAAVIERLRCTLNGKVVSEEIFYPIEWSFDPNDESPRKGFRTVAVDANSEEYKTLENFFKATSASTVSSIIRIQNDLLWRAYCLRKRRMEEVLGKGGAKERFLYHGTYSKCMDPICEQGFDHRLYGTTSGHAYGQGSYFSATASLSSSYAKEKSMFVAKVLIGDYCRGSSSMRRPAPKNSAQPNGLLYDTTVDNVDNPTIFVTYQSDQAYPAYIINYA